MDQPRPRLFGVVLAGGRSRRFGSPKARVRVAGRTLLERALGILREAGLETGVIANRAADLPLLGDALDRDVELGGTTHTDGAAHPPRRDGARTDGQPSVAVPVRADLKAGAGPLGGLHAALCWARERGDEGVFLLGCDLPLVLPHLVRRIARSFDPARPTVPASGGPLGIEPLCACYPVSLVSAVEESLGEGRFGMGKFVRAASPVVVTRDQLALVADLERVFFNVNTPADAERAGVLLRAPFSSA